MIRPICHKLLAALGVLFLTASLAACNGSTTGGGTPAPAPASVVQTRFAFTGNGDGTVSVFGVDGGALRYAGYAVTGTTPAQALAVAPDDRHLYVLGAGGTINAYAVDGTSGALSAVDTVTAGSAGSDLLLSAAGRFLYSVDSAGGTVSAFAVSGTTGGLSAVGSAVATGAEPVGIALAPSGAFAYVVNGTGQSVSVYTRDTASGILNPSTTTSLPAKPTAITLNYAGTFAYVTFAAAAANVGVYHVDASTGDLAPVQTVDADDTPMDFALNADGTFAYVAAAKGDRIDVFAVASDGRLTAVQTIASPPSPRALAVGPEGRYLYAATFTDGDLAVYGVDSSTGRLTADTDTRGRTGSSAVALASGDSAYTVKAAYLFGPDGNVHLFPVTDSTGALGAPATEAAGTDPVQVALTPDNRFAYVVNRTSHTVSVFGFDAGGGALGALVETDQVPSEWLQSLPIDIIRAVVDPSGRFLYLLDHRGSTSVNGRIAVYAIDSGSGALTYQGQVSSAGLSPTDLAMHPAGGYLYAVNSDGNSVAAFSVDPGTGAITRTNVFQTGGGGRPIAMTFTPGGRYAYLTLESGLQLVRYQVAANGDLTNATAVTVSAAQVPTDPRPRYMAVDPAGRYAYVSHWNGDVSTWTVDSGTRALTFAGAAAVGSLPSRIAADPNGQFVYTVVTGGIARLTVGTGGALNLQEVTSTGTVSSDYRTATIVSTVH